MDSVTKSNFKLPTWDAKKISTTTIGIGLLAVLGFYVYSKILPWLLGIVWGTVELVIGGVIAFALVYIVCSKRFWRGMHYLLEGFTRYTLGLVIEMNPFEILLEQVEDGEKNAKKLKVHGDEMKAQQISLTTEIAEKNEDMRQSAAQIKVCQKTLAATPGDFQAGLDLQTSSTNFTNAKEYIDSLQPMQSSVSQMADFADKAYRKSMAELANQRNTIKMNKQKFAIVTSANAAMSSAVKAFFGDDDRNRDADQALDAIKRNLAKQLGNIKSNIELTSEAMSHIDLRDAAKMSLAVDAANQFEIDQNMDYSSTLDASKGILGLDQQRLIAGASPVNKYADFLNTKK